MVWVLYSDNFRVKEYSMFNLIAVYSLQRNGQPSQAFQLLSSANADSEFFFNVESSCSHVINLVTRDEEAQWIKGSWHQAWQRGFVPEDTYGVWKETTNQAVLWLLCVFCGTHVHAHTDTNGKCLQLNSIWNVVFNFVTLILLKEK